MRKKSSKQKGTKARIVRISRHVRSLTKKKERRDALRAVHLFMKQHPFRFGAILLIAGVVIAGIIVAILSTLVQASYYLGSSGSLLPDANTTIARSIKYDNKKQVFTFTNGEVAGNTQTIRTGAQQLTVSASADASKGITVTDPVYGSSFTMSPTFGLKTGRQEDNRIVYPLSNGNGWAVYTMQNTGTKEDILLNRSTTNSMDLDYTLNLGDSLVAKVESDGSIGVYGNNIFSGDVSTGSSSDAQLLLKARQNAPKTTLMFTVPKPVILENGNKQSSASAVYVLQGNNLRVVVTGLEKAHYPLSIDPSIYVVTAQQFMQGNNESNINFDVANKLIDKTPATGARFNSWNATSSLPSANWSGSTVATGGFLYSIGGSASSGVGVSWTQFDPNTGLLTSPNPGNGACSTWCTNSAYNLPAARTNFSLAAYDGFLYVIGGLNGTTQQSTVYIAKIGANGEPQLWHPTDPNKANWVYWYQDTGLTSARSDLSAVAYNNRMYLMGGRSSTGPINTVEVANVNPTGTLGTWSSSNALPVNAYGGSGQVYNDRLYFLGGDSTVGGAPLNSVYYTKINSDGTLNSWNATSSFTNGRISGGGTFSAIWGAYLYISGGCTAVNASGYCTTVASDTQLASINADGSLDLWGTIGGVSNQAEGASFIAWRNNMYDIGGCSVQNTTTGACTTTSAAIVYGSINSEGDASTVAQSVASGTSPCSGTTPTNCNLPGTTYVGDMLSAAVITNGYLYVIGGCTNNTCSTTTGNVAYVAISSTGTMQKPATCPVGAYQGSAWCVDTTDTISGGIAATSAVVFNNRIYLVGGLNGSANTNSIVRTTLNPDGSISAWTSQTLTGVGASSVSYLFAYARSNPASAGTNPGNLYIFGGCATSSAAGCTAYSQGVYKCNIQTAGAIAGCSTTGQLQIGIIPGDSATGLGIMSGTVYANYVYLVGGVSPNLVDLASVRYAKIDSNNNVVAVSGSAWIQSPNVMAVGRRRAAAFGYNGYIYAVGGYDGTSGNVLADIEFIKVNVSDGSLGNATTGFVVSSVTINQRWGLSVPVSNSFAYVIGGCTTGASPGSCTARTDVVQTFQIYNNDDGAPSGYTTSANTYATSPSRIGQASTILNGYIYVAGGCTSTTDCTTAISDVSYAPIDIYGNVGTWTSTGALPAVRTWGRLASAGGTLYYLGGQSSTSTDIRAEVYYATPSSGAVASWTQASNGLPGGRTQFGSDVWNNRIYVVGGQGSNTGCTSGVCNTVYVSPQLNGGGDITSAWSTGSTSFNIPRSGLTAVTYANNLYLFGGFDGTNYLSDSQFTQINATTGLVGSWSYSESLPGPLSQAGGFAANGYIYLIGGRSAATTCSPITLVAPISANTTIVSGNNPTGIGAWFVTNQRYTANRYGSSAVYSNGKAYVLGGGCGSTLTYASPVIQQTPLLSQPQIAKYSIRIDTDSDVFPTNWLINGLDNSIGAKWQLKYRSMTNTTTSCTTPAMTTWGQETNFGNVTLGLPTTYTPLNGSGVTTNCARFYYLNVSVDSSLAFGYPDDVSRGPTISDMTLQFTADPSKRLMHGRTFTGGLQQPIDTPYYAH